MSRAPRPQKKAAAPKRASKARKRETATLGRRLAAMAGGGLVVVAVAALAVGGGAVWLYGGPGPKAKNGEYTSVVLRRGASVSEIAGALEAGGAIRSSSLFLTAAQITGAARRLKAGEYEFPNRASLSTVLAMVRDGKVVRHQVTVPEGVTSEMVVEILQRSPVLVGDVPTPPEGAVLPETYQVERGEERAAVLQRMMDDRDKVLNALWEQRQQGLPFQTKDEAVTLASIVEKETALASERPRVAALFTNRLRLGMRLDTDPTVIYGITRGRPLGRGLRRSELDAFTPYNTYKITGLPPTPIANPGREALAAVMNPPKTDELYFVADGTGGHVFAKTYEEHERNVAQWRQIERQAKAATASATAGN